MAIVGAPKPITSEAAKRAVNIIPPGERGKAKEAPQIKGGTYAEPQGRGLPVETKEEEVKEEPIPPQEPPKMFGQQPTTFISRDPTKSYYGKEVTVFNERTPGKITRPDYDVTIDNKKIRVSAGFYEKLNREQGAIGQMTIGGQKVYTTEPSQARKTTAPKADEGFEGFKSSYTQAKKPNIFTRARRMVEKPFIDIYSQMRPLSTKPTNEFLTKTFFDPDYKQRIEYTSGKLGQGGGEVGRFVGQTYKGAATYVTEKPLEAAGDVALGYVGGTILKAVELPKKLKLSADIAFIGVGGISGYQEYKETGGIGKTGIQFSLMGIGGKSAETKPIIKSEPIITKSPVTTKGTILESDKRFAIESQSERTIKAFSQKEYMGIPIGEAKPISVSKINVESVLVGRGRTFEDVAKVKIETSPFSTKKSKIEKLTISDKFVLDKGLAIKQISRAKAKAVFGESDILGNIQIPTNPSKKSVINVREGLKPEIAKKVYRHELSHYFDKNLKSIAKDTYKGTPKAVIKINSVVKSVGPMIDLAKLNKLSGKYGPIDIMRDYDPMLWASEAKAYIAGNYPREIRKPTTRTGKILSRELPEVKIEGNKLFTKPKTYETIIKSEDIITGKPIVSEGLIVSKGFTQGKTAYSTYESRLNKLPVEFGTQTTKSVPVIEGEGFTIESGATTTTRLGIKKTTETYELMSENYFENLAASVGTQGQITVSPVTTLKYDKIGFQYPTKGITKTVNLQGLGKVTIESPFTPKEYTAQLFKASSKDLAFTQGKIKPLEIDLSKATFEIPKTPTQGKNKIVGDFVYEQPNIKKVEPIKIKDSKLTTVESQSNRMVSELQTISGTKQINLPQTLEIAEIQTIKAIQFPKSKSIYGAGYALKGIYGQKLKIQQTHSPIMENLVITSPIQTIKIEQMPIIATEAPLFGKLTYRNIQKEEPIQPLEPKSTTTTGISGASITSYQNIRGGLPKSMNMFQSKTSSQFRGRGAKTFYVPSLTALGLNIKGKVTQKKFGGVELRPIKLTKR